MKKSDGFNKRSRRETLSHNDIEKIVDDTIESLNKIIEPTKSPDYVNELNRCLRNKKKYITGYNSIRKISEPIIFPNEDSILFKLKRFWINNIWGKIIPVPIRFDSGHPCSKEYLMYRGWKFCPYCGRKLKLIGDK